MMRFIFRFITTFLTLKELTKHVQDNDRDRRETSGGDQEPDGSDPRPTGDNR